MDIPQICLRPRDVKWFPGILPMKIKEEVVDDAIYNDSQFVLPCDTSATTVSDNTKFEKFMSLNAEIRRLYKLHLKNNLLLWITKKAVCEDDSTSKSYSHKVQQIFFENEKALISNNFLKSRDQDSVTILGLKRPTYWCPNLTFSDKIHLQSDVENVLFKECSTILQCKSQKADLFTEVKSLSEINSENMNLIKSLHNDLKLFGGNVLEFKGFASELMKFSLSFSETLKTTLIPWFEAKCEYLELQARVLELEVLVNYFRELEHFPQATSEACYRSQALLEKVKLKVKRLRNNARDYHCVTSAEYSTILKEYKFHKEQLFKTEVTLKMCNEY